MYKNTLFQYLLAWQGLMMNEVFPDSDVYIDFVYRRKKKLWSVTVLLDLGHPYPERCEAWIYTRDEHGRKVNEAAFLTEVISATDCMQAKFLRDTGRDQLRANRC